MVYNFLKRNLNGRRYAYGAIRCDGVCTATYLDPRGLTGFFQEEKLHVNMLVLRDTVTLFRFPVYSNK